MNIIILDEHNYFGVLSEAEKTLRAGGVIVGPTDTVYGIFGRADRASTIKRIFDLKKRENQKALPIFVKDIAMARKYAYISDVKAKFLEHVWPGRVTIIFHHKSKLPKELTGDFATIGMRMLDYSLLLDILGKYKMPLAQTSANISGKPPAKNIQEIKAYFEDQEEQPDLVIDAGVIDSQPSTVIDFTGSKPLVVRSGMMNKSDFDQMCRSMI